MELTNLMKHIRSACKDYGYKLIDNNLIFEDAASEYKAKIIINGIRNRRIITLKILESKPLVDGVGQAFFDKGDELNLMTILYWNRKIEKDPLLNRILNHKNYSHARPNRHIKL